MLISMQNQQVAEWVNNETQHNRKRRKSTHECAISNATDLSNQAILTDEQQKGQDREMRQFFSATAHMWQDGSGQGVADVFAVASSSSPVESFDSSHVFGPSDKIPSLESGPPTVERDDPKPAVAEQAG